MAKSSTCAMIEGRRCEFRRGLRTERRTRRTGRSHLHTSGWSLPSGSASAASPLLSSQFAEAFERVHSCVEKLLAAGAIDWHTTYFETVTAMAFLIFLDERVDMVALEVGLGGRLDATNVVRPDLCVITQIDYDHEAFLGKSLESIAGEKAGILKTGAPAVFSRQRPEAARVLDLRAAQLGISVTRTDAWSIGDLELDPRGSRFLLSGERELRIRCPLAGEHQVENAATAAIALTRLGVAERAIESGIAQAVWPGRLEHVSERPEIILDGAHNPAGARALAAYIRRFLCGPHAACASIYGAMREQGHRRDRRNSVPVRPQQVIVTAPRQAYAASPPWTRRRCAISSNMKICVPRRLGSKTRSRCWLTLPTRTPFLSPDRCFWLPSATRYDWCEAMSSCPLPGSSLRSL